MTCASANAPRSDHCPAMKGIKTAPRRQERGTRQEAQQSGAGWQGVRRWLPPSSRHAPRGRSRAAPRSFPSLRGRGRFAVATRRGSATPHAGAAALRPDHYPLHCGAVVASQWRRGAAAPRPTRAQPRCAPIIIPFIAGQWSLHAYLPGHRGYSHRVSIPFIAGQWSLPSGE